MILLFVRRLVVELLVDLFKLGIGDMGVNLRRGDIFVPQHLLDGPKVSPAGK